jgi:hypothetical protein
MVECAIAYFAKLVRFIFLLDFTKKLEERRVANVRANSSLLMPFSRIGFTSYFLQSWFEATACNHKIFPAILSFKRKCEWNIGLEIGGRGIIVEWHSKGMMFR